MPTIIIYSVLFPCTTRYLVLPISGWLSHVVSQVLLYKSLPDSKYQVLQVFPPLIPLKTSSAKFILLPQNSYLNKSHEFQPCHTLCLLTFSFIMMLGKYFYTITKRIMMEIPSMVWDLCKAVFQTLIASA